MQRDNILVSIIVRTKDRPALLKRAIMSIAQQTYAPIEVVLVNDGGCDLDIDELKTILSDVSLNYVRLEKNTGRSHAANVGIDNAHGEYIGFLDDDDEFYPEHLHILTETLKKDEMKIAYTDAEMVFGEFRGQEIIETFRYVFYSHEFSPAALLLQNYIPFMCLLFPRYVFNEVRFDESFDIFEDWMFLIQLSEKYWFKHIKRVTARYVQWSDESQINRRALSEDFSQEAYKRVLERNIGKISPEVIYTYCVYAATEKQKFLDELIKKEADYFQEKLNLTNELMRLRSDKLKLEIEKQRFETEKREIESEKEDAERALKNLQDHITELSTGLGWNLLGRYRKVKEQVIPPNTKRRRIYDLCLKSVKTLKNEGFKGLVSKAKRKSRKEARKVEYRLGLNRFRTVRHETTKEKCEFIPKPVYIIMPVFNGYECLRGCIDSILGNTNLYRDTLVIINDRSTDGRVQEYLRKIRRERNGRNIFILYNRRNSGFTKTVNRGMRLSPEDVILLNSDTVVTQNWVTKLQRAAYSQPRAATATPLSNYVTINGIPEPFRYNTIPGAMDIDTFASFLDRISLRYYPEIPAGVGFCLYIKRSVLDHMGYFDEKQFGRGYAEETDFCMRALKNGYIHVLDDATYIYHIGGVSFESVKDPEVLREKNMMIEKNLETLKTLHPEYSDLVEKALQENLLPVHSYINLRLKSMENTL